MPRKARKKSNSGIYHIMMRGINAKPFLKMKKIMRDLLKPYSNTRGKAVTKYMHVFYIFWDGSWLAWKKVKKIF